MNKSTNTASNNHTLTIDNVRENIVGIDAPVPLLDGSHRIYVNFDNAASTPSLRPVLDKVSEFMTWYSSVHRGTGFKSQISTEAYDEAHRVVCDFVGADPATHTVIFGKNSTESLNKLARRLPMEADDVIRWKRPGKIEDNKAWMIDRSPSGLGFLTRAKTAPRVGDTLNIRRLEDERWATIERSVRVARTTPTLGHDLVMIGCSIE